MHRLVELELNLLKWAILALNSFIMLEISPTQRALQNMNAKLNQSALDYAAQRTKDLRAKSYFDMFSLNEGNKPQVYKDTAGNRTIGIGFNLEDEGNRRFLKQQNIDINELFDGRPLSDRETKILYNHSLTQAFNDAQKFDPNLARRPEAVRMAIVDMAFNLGLTKLNKFVDMKAALMNNDYNTAADEMVDSNWYKQVKSRGPRMVNVMRSAAR